MDSFYSDYDLGLILLILGSKLILFVFQLLAGIFCLSCRKRTKGATLTGIGFLLVFLSNLLTPLMTELPMWWKMRSTREFEIFLVGTIAEWAGYACILNGLFLAWNGSDWHSFKQDPTHDPEAASNPHTHSPYRPEQEMSHDIWP